MSLAQSVGVLPLAFAAAVHDLSRFRWDQRIHITEIDPPAHIAPYAAAIDADIEDDAGTGRLILLHDPAGNELWGGDFRCVTFAQADVTPEMVHDPCLAYVGWSWLTEALAAHAAPYSGESGTITTTASTPFGTKADEATTSLIEIRGSWTPRLEPGDSLIPHLAAWQDLLRRIAGIADDADTVVPLLAARR